MANNYGLLTVTVARKPEPGKPTHADLLPPEPDGGGKVVLCYGPMLLIDAIWQQFAREGAGIITCAKCPAPNCGRWFPRNQTRSDRQYCSHACRMRAWRRGAT